MWTASPGSRVSGPFGALLSLVTDPEKLKRQMQEGEAGGHGPLEELVPEKGESPIVKPVPGATRYGPLENIPSPLTAIPLSPKPAHPSESPGDPS